MSDVPDFDSLPAVEGQPQGNAWGFWGKYDQLGTLNLLTPDVVLAAREEIKTGRSVSLDMRLDYLTYRIADRQEFTQRLMSFMDRDDDFKMYGFDDELHINTQSSSQWDGLRHFALQNSGLYYNGVKHTDISAKQDGRNGIHNWSERGGIVGRGVLLDYVRWREETGQPVARADSAHPITVSELDKVAKHQNVTFKTGDILIIRSGFTQWHDRASQEERVKVFNQGAFIGLERSMRSVKWLWNHHFAALAGDTIGFECFPAPFGAKDEVILHEWIIAHWGSPLGELWNLETLSQLCAATKQWSFFFTSAPLRVYGGVASPPNAIAIF